MCVLWFIKANEHNKTRLICTASIDEKEIYLFFFLFLQKEKEIVFLGCYFLLEWMILGRHIWKDVIH